LLEAKGKTALDASQTQNKNQAQEGCCKEHTTLTQAIKKKEQTKHHKTPNQVRITMRVAERAIHKGNKSCNTEHQMQGDYNTEQWGHTRRKKKVLDILQYEVNERDVH